MSNSSLTIPSLIEELEKEGCLKGFQLACQYGEAWGKLAEEMKDSMTLPTLPGCSVFFLPTSSSLVFSLYVEGTYSITLKDKQPQAQVRVCFMDETTKIYPIKEVLEALKNYKQT